jgi:predicted AlkP superfamily phosphohydrolase/phosphomutase
MRKVLVLCLDSVPPELLFDRLLDKMPNVQKLYRTGIHGILETCHPPITVPAWMVIMTGRNPRRLGIYGFRHRKGSSYKDGYIVSSNNVKESAIWDAIGSHGLKSCIIGLPPSYPPKPLNGHLVTCMITPSTEKQFTYPSELKDEIKRTVGEYIFDVTFRTENRDAVRDELFLMTRKRFDLAEYLAKEKNWNLFILHEIGFDRLHHAFWKFFDPSHPKYVSGNKYERIAEEYYAFVDERIGKLLDLVGNDVSVFVLSDHGSKAMKGAFCINQWLMQEGFLTLRKQPEGVLEIEKAEIDWTKTKAWAWGGYYARIFFNIRNRETEGIIDSKELETVKADLVGRLKKVRDPSGRLMDNVIFEPDKIYGEARGDKPDLMVYLDGLDWRSAGTIGHKSLYLAENDTGPDDSVHSMEGVFIYKDAYTTNREIKGAKAEDIAPTLLKIFDIPIPGDMGGKALELS